MALVEIAVFHDAASAQIARGRLASAGIEAILFDVEMSWLGSIIPIRMMVDEDDQAEAEQLLAGD